VNSLLFQDDATSVTGTTRIQWRCTRDILQRKNQLRRFSTQLIQSIRTRQDDNRTFSYQLQSTYLTGKRESAVLVRLQAAFQSPSHRTGWYEAASLWHTDGCVPQCLIQGDRPSTAQWARLERVASRQQSSHTSLCILELHGNGDVDNSAETADFPVNLAVIPRGWSTLLRGYRGSGPGCQR